MYAAIRLLSETLTSTAPAWEKVRHIETPDDWIQDTFGRQVFELVKLVGEHNIAGVRAELAPQDAIMKHPGTLG